MFLARKITRAKWSANQELGVGEIPADAVTIDLRTVGNSLSFWQCPTDTASDVEEVALAIAAAHQHLERLDIVCLDDEELRADGQSLRNTEGNTPVADLASKHVDVARLDSVRLGKVAERVVSAMESSRFRRLPKSRVKELLVTAVGQGRLDPEDLHYRIRSEVASLL